MAKSLGCMTIFRSSSREVQTAYLSTEIESLFGVFCRQRFLEVDAKNPPRFHEDLNVDVELVLSGCMPLAITTASHLPISIGRFLSLALVLVCFHPELGPSQAMSDPSLIPSMANAIVPFSNANPYADAFKLQERNFVIGGRSLKIQQRSDKHHLPDCAEMLRKLCLESAQRDTRTRTSFKSSCLLVPKHLGNDRVC
jgi:hypothetical protein